jgi:hypothetical protein
MSAVGQRDMPYREILAAQLPHRLWRYWRGRRCLPSVLFF